MAGAAREYTALLDDTAASIYVIDKQTYELLYVNENARRASGSRDYRNAQCFRFFNGLEAPCPWCSLPLMKDGSAHIDENYVPPLKRWYRHDVRDIDWYGRSAAAFYITNISDQKRRQELEEARFANLCRQIAAANPNALGMTADAFEQSVREAKAAGMSGYVTKPIDPARLAQTLRDAMEGRPSADS